MKQDKNDFSNELTTFRDRLVDELSYQDIPYKVFAGMIGISLSTLNTYLYRDSMPAADVAVKMAKALNVSTEYLVTGEPKIERPEPKTNSFVQKVVSPKKEILKILNTLSQNELECFLQITIGFKSAISMR